MPVLSPVQIAAVARRAGFPAAAAVTAVAITTPESSRNSSAIQQGVPYSAQGWGLWQITPGDSVPQFGINQQLLDPLNNARAAFFKSDGGTNFGPWTTYENGLEVPYLAAAQAAVAEVYKLSPAQLAAAVAAARTGAPASPGSGTGAADWSVWVTYAAGQGTTVNRGLVSAGTALAALRGRPVTPVVRPPAPGAVVVRPERL